MNLTCVHCGKLFQGDNTKFCTQGCRDSYIVAIDKRTREAVRDVPNHTTNMSKN